MAPISPHAKMICAEAAPSRPKPQPPSARAESNQSIVLGRSIESSERDEPIQRIDRREQLSELRQELLQRIIARELQRQARREVRSS